MKYGKLPVKWNVSKNKCKNINFSIKETGRTYLSLLKGSKGTYGLTPISSLFSSVNSKICDCTCSRSHMNAITEPAATIFIIFTVPRRSPDEILKILRGIISGIAQVIASGFIHAAVLFHCLPATFSWPPSRFLPDPATLTSPQRTAQTGSGASSNACGESLPPFCRQKKSIYNKVNTPFLFPFSIFPRSVAFFPSFWRVNALSVRSCVPRVACMLSIMYIHRSYSTISLATKALWVPLSLLASRMQITSSPASFASRKYCRNALRWRLAGCRKFFRSASIFVKTSGLSTPIKIFFSPDNTLGNKNWCQFALPAVLYSHKSNHK